MADVGLDDGRGLALAQFAEAPAGGAALAGGDGDGGRARQFQLAYPGSFTANTELLAGEEFASAAPYNAVFAASLDHLQDFWNVPVYNELLAAAVRHLGAALDGTSASEEALDTLAAEHEMILMEAGLLEME